LLDLWPLTEAAVLVYSNLIFPEKDINLFHYLIFIISEMSGPVRMATKRQFEVDVKRAADEFGNNKRQKIILAAGSNNDSNAVDSGANSPAPIASKSAPLSPVPEKQPIGPITKKPNQKVQSVGPYRLLAPLEENSQTFTAVDTRKDGRLVICRRLDRSKYTHMMQLSHRLLFEIKDADADEAETNKRAYEQIFPATSELIAGDDGHFYFFEPKNYGSLHAYVVERKRLGEQECLWFFRQIVALLDYCHRRRIVLRDLKLRKFVFADPERLTIRLDGIDELFVCPDKKDEDEDDSQDDKISDRHGCPAYVGPEILDLNQKSFSGRAADMWSLGVLLYVVLYGRYPFYDTTPARLFAKIRHAQIHLAEEAGISFDARSLIRCLLRRDPSERPSALDILAHPWLQSRDRSTNTTRRCGAGYLVNTVNGIRFVMDKESESDQCVPCADGNDKADIRKQFNGPVKEIRRAGGSEGAVPSQ